MGNGHFQLVGWLPFGSPPGLSRRGWEPNLGVQPKARGPESGQPARRAAGTSQVLKQVLKQVWPRNKEVSVAILAQAFFPGLLCPPAHPSRGGKEWAGLQPVASAFLFLLYASWIGATGHRLRAPSQELKGPENDAARSGKTSVPYTRDYTKTSILLWEN